MSCLTCLLFLALGIVYEVRDSAHFTGGVAPRWDRLLQLPGQPWWPGGAQRAAEGSGTDSKGGKCTQKEIWFVPFKIMYSQAGNQIYLVFKHCPSITIPSLISQESGSDIKRNKHNQPWGVHMIFWKKFQNNQSKGLLYLILEVRKETWSNYLSGCGVFNIGSNSRTVKPAHPVEMSTMWVSCFEINWL